MQSAVIHHTAAPWAAVLLPTILIAQPTLTPPVVVPGDSVPAAAVGQQSDAHISRGSTSFLVVWSDNRSSLLRAGVNGPYYGRGLGTMLDIYGSRVDFAGNLLDTTPIVISKAQYNQTSPKVAWNGQNWLVVWMTEREDDRYAYDVMATRVAPDGHLLDSTPIVVFSALSSIDQYTPWSVSSDGTNWAIVYRGLDSAAAIYTLAGIRVAPDGRLLDAGGKTLR